MLPAEDRVLNLLEQLVVALARNVLGLRLLHLRRRPHLLLEGELRVREGELSVGVVRREKRLLQREKVLLLHARVEEEGLVEVRGKGDRRGKRVSRLEGDVVVDRLVDVLGCRRKRSLRVLG